MATQSIRKVWTFQSDSNSSKTYETLLYINGTTSCNCPGWTRHVRNFGRSCKHTRYVDQGLADRMSLSCYDYSNKTGDSPFDEIATTHTRTVNSQRPKKQNQSVPAQEPEKKIKTIPIDSGRRKVIWL